MEVDAEADCEGGNGGKDEAKHHGPPHCAHVARHPLVVFTVPGGFHCSAQFCAVPALTAPASAKPPPTTISHWDQFQMCRTGRVTMRGTAGERGEM